MSAEFTVLASGSRGNASLIRSGGSGVLIDLGLGARTMIERMESVGAGWGQVASAVLTHTHGDHVQSSTMRALAKHKIPLYCHEAHASTLAERHGFTHLDRAGCVRTYDDRPFLTPDGLRVEPIELSHDGGPTFGFRVEARPGRKGRAVSVGYLADTGCWKRKTADLLTDVDVLGVEFNHDVAMQLGSGRAPYLIRRNLGDRGHLSNDQGAALVSAVLERSSILAVRHVVLLHLSEQCNHPSLAINAARAAVKAGARRCRVHAASQWQPHPHLPISAARRKAVVAGSFPWETGEPDASPFRLSVD
jgi:phosphoribosyl 1,2-cyclic phosphodiesterase